MPKFEKPASLKDIMSSDSSESDEEDPRAKGLTSAAKHIGEGAVLYLQTMKTFAAMFFTLSLINLPVYYAYYD